MKIKRIIGLLLAAGVTAANAHVIGSINDGGERITLTDKRSCDGCEFEAGTTAKGMNAIVELHRHRRNHSG